MYRRNTIIALIIFFVILMIIGYILKIEPKFTKFGENLNNVKMEYTEFTEGKISKAWEITFINNGEDLHNCSISIDEYSTEIKNVHQRYTFFDGLKKKIENNTFSQNMEIVIYDNSDYSHTKFFFNEAGEKYPGRTWPKKISLNCDEGTDVWGTE